MELDAGLIARIDQLHATGSTNLNLIIDRAAEAREQGWGLPAVAVLVGQKLIETDNMDRSDLALLVGVAVTKLIHIAEIAEQARNEL